MSITPTVLAICVNWNGGELLPQTLKALLASDYSSLQVLVVDSASTDGSAEQLPSDILLLTLSENGGYAAGLNQGWAWALARGISPDYVLVLNNDIQLEVSCLKRLVSTAQQNKPSICGPKVLQWNQPDRMEASWGELHWNHVLAKFHDRNCPDDERQETREVELLLGCALLIPREVIERLGPWDENYFLYHEEIDYLYRAHQQGIAVLYVPSARAFHWSGWGHRGNSLQKVFWVRRNTVYFFRKHGASAGKWLRFSSSLLASLTWNFLTLRWSRLTVICRGVLSGFRMEASGG